MRKVITYGTYDLLHYGHVKLLQRAKALGNLTGMKNRRNAISPMRRERVCWKRSVM